MYGNIIIAQYGTLTRCTRYVHSIHRYVDTLYLNLDELSSIGPRWFPARDLPVYRVAVLLDSYRSRDPVLSIPAIDPFPATCTRGLCYNQHVWSRQQAISRTSRVIRQWSQCHNSCRSALLSSCQPLRVVLIWSWEVVLIPI